MITMVKMMIILVVVMIIITIKKMIIMIMILTVNIMNDKDNEQLWAILEGAT